MAEFDEGSKLTLEEVMAKAYQEIGETIARMGNEVSDIPDFISRFLQGDRRIGWGAFQVVYRKGEALAYADLVEKAKPLFDQARDIWLEKGYRHTGALLTAREHKECGSSGYEQFIAMPDTVVSIANRTLKLMEEKKEPMSIEEIRRARILDGMLTIDDAGKVTGEIVPITDSYHFLSEERKAEVKELEQCIVLELKGVVREAVARTVERLTSYAGIVRELANGNLSRASGYSRLERLNMPLEVADKAMELAYQDGHKDKILTPMEILLLGREVGEKFKSKPYTPLGVQKGRLSVEDASKARAEERFFDLNTDLFSGYSYPVALSLEPLNAEGRTLRGPLVLDHRTKKPIDDRMVEMCKEHVKAIPFSRHGDWYHRSADSPPLRQ